MREVSQRPEELDESPLGPGCCWGACYRKLEAPWREDLAGRVKVPQSSKLAALSSPWQGVPAVALPEAGGVAQPPQRGASLPCIPVCALCSHLASCEAAGGSPHLPEPGYAGPGKRGVSGAASSGDRAQGGLVW